MENNSTWIDTIVALATPPGVGAIGIIRLSGIKSFDIINKLFPSKDLKLFPSHTLHVGYLRYADKILDEVVISIYKAPNSYTGEDVIELSCHGSAFIQQEILEIIIQNGGRIAKPGEFTQRAFLNGKLDLVQAEAVADLIASDTSASQRAALHNMRGGFSKSLKNLREELIKFSSLIELELDFSEEDVEFADRNKFINLIDHILKETRRLLDSFKHGNVIKNGVNVAIIGKPNAGKSTLLNTFLNEERAIVSEIAGTTRDTIEEIININGILFRLIDTAGIRDKTQDIIENMGIMKSLEKMKQADIILYLFDMGEMDNVELKTIENNFLKENRKFILVGNKDDIIDVNEKKNNSLSGNIIYISAKKNKGIEALKQKIFTAVSGNEIITENIILTNARHYSSLQSLKNFLDDIKEGLSNKIPADLLAIDIRSCMYYVGEITGQITNEDQLDFIFSKFCIGK